MRDIKSHVCKNPGMGELKLLHRQTSHISHDFCAFGNQLVTRVRLCGLIAGDR